MSWKTSLIGIIGIVFLFVGLGLVYLKLATLTELGISLALVTTFLSSMGNFFAKDSDVTGGTRQQ